VTELESFRQPLTEVFPKHPELFPAGISEGFVLHDTSWSIKQQVMRRRIALKATAGGFLVRPSFLLPSMVGRTEAVEKALSLRGIRLRRDSWVSVMYAEGLNSTTSSATLQRTDRHGILGQKSSHFQVFV
jgi:hypothetical protein